VVSFTTRPLYSQGKSPWYTLDRRLGGPQSRSGHGGEEKNSQPADMEGICEYIEQILAVSQQGVEHQFGGWARG
jgi:hypothetical protein